MVEIAILRVFNLSQWEILAVPVFGVAALTDHRYTSDSTLLLKLDMDKCGLYCL